MDSNHHNEIQSLVSCQLDDLSSTSPHNAMYMPMPAGAGHGQQATGDACMFLHIRGLQHVSSRNNNVKSNRNCNIIVDAHQARNA